MHIGFDSLDKKRFDSFVEGGEAAAENMFQNRGRPFSCLSTRFGGVNYRVSMLIGMAGEDAKHYINIYNPNFWNRFSVKREGESDEDVKARTNGRWLLSFLRALEHTKRTGGKLVQVRTLPAPLAPGSMRALAAEPTCVVLSRRRSLCRPTTRTASTATCRRRRS